MKEGCQGAIRFSGYRVIDMDYHCLREYTMPEDGVLQLQFRFSEGNRISFGWENECFAHSKSFLWAR